MSAQPRHDLRPRPPPAGPPRRRRRSLAPLAYGAPALALAAAGAGLYRRLHSSVPPLDGTLFCPVRAPVRVVRDAWGIPHIYAGNAADLFTALGLRAGAGSPLADGLAAPHRRGAAVGVVRPDHAGQ